MRALNPGGGAFMLMVLLAISHQAALSEGQAKDANRGSQGLPDFREDDGDVLELRDDNRDGR